MRTIERSSAFKRDLKRLAKGRYHAVLNNDLLRVLEDLVNNRQLHSKHRDHDLIGDWHGYRECHIKADLLLIYSHPDRDSVRLARLGTHSEIFG